MWSSEFEDTCHGTPSQIRVCAMKIRVFTCTSSVCSLGRVSSACSFCTRERLLSLNDPCISGRFDKNPFYMVYELKGEKNTPCISVRSIKSF